MPTPDAIRETVDAYLQKLNDSDIDGIMALYTSDATVQDPVGGPVQEGAEAIASFYGGAAPLLHVERTGPICVAGNECAFPLLARLTTPDATSYLDATDVLTFNDDGLITSMKAYWNPAEFRENP